MMRIFQIALLWLAGALLVGHSIIPHHHHETEQEFCAENNHEHDHNHDHNHDHDNGNEHSNKLEAFNDCCNEPIADHEACTINQRTIVKDNSAPLALFGSATLKLPNLRKPICKLWHNYTIGITSDAFWDYAPSRAPPLA